MKIAILFLLMVFPAFAQQAVSEKTKEKTTDVAEVKKELPRAIIKTNFGDITVEFYPEIAPKTVKNFLDLAAGDKEFTDQLGKKVKRPFFDGLIFHRVMKDFMIQGGCPQGTGTGDPGYRFEDEINAKALGLDKEKFLVDGIINSKLQVYPQQQIQAMLAPIYQKLGVNSEETFKAKKEEVIKAVDALTIEEVYTNLGYKFDDKLKSIPMKRGFLAMANSGPNTNGSQFFINLTDNRYLDGKHTVFAKVISGMIIVDKISETKVQGSKPIDPVKIESIRVQK